MNVGVTASGMRDDNWQLVCDTINDAQRGMYDAMNLPAWRELYKDDGEISVIPGTTRYSLDSRMVQRLGAWNTDPNSYPSIKIEVITEDDADRIGLRNPNFRAGSPLYAYIVPAPPHNEPLFDGSGADATEGAYTISIATADADGIDSTAVGYEIFLNNEDAAYIVTNVNTSGDPVVITVDRPIRSRVSGDETGHVGDGYADVPWYVRRYGAQRIDILPEPMMPFTLRYRYMQVPLWMQSDTDRPSMPDNWHDALVYKASALVATIQEKMDVAAAWEAKWLVRLGECRSRQLQLSGTVSTIRTMGFNQPRQNGPYIPFDGQIGPLIRRGMY